VRSGARIRVAVVDQIPTPYRQPLYRQLHECGRYDLHVYFGGHSPVFDQWRDLAFGFPATMLGGLKIPVRRIGDVVLMNPGIVRRLVVDRPDVVLVSGWMQPTSLMAVATARASGIPYIVLSESHSGRARGPLARASRSLVFSRIVRRAGALMTTGSRARAYLTELGALPESIFTWPNACDVDEIARLSEEARATGEAERLRVEIGGDRPTVVFAGRLVRAKAVEVLLRALRRPTDDSGKGLACAVAGAGPEEQALKALTRELALPSVRFLGEVPPERLPALYAAADVLCLPSRDEPWGVVVNEALAAGTPVVASDAVGATADLIRDGENGFTFRTGDPLDLAMKLRAALQLDRDSARSRSRSLLAACDYRAGLDGFQGATEFALSRASAGA
jgi:glycosyltransferase involved in cell wall biosynthesis